MFAYKSNAQPYQITLLRHGQSIGNIEGRYQGQADFPLTETGVAQAQALAEGWAREGKIFDGIITSPLMRARQTAEIIAKVLDLPLEEDPIWKERDNGVMAGLRPEEAQIKSPRPDFVTPYHVIGESGESQWQLYLRAGRAVQMLMVKDPGNYLVVSHGALLNMVLYAMFGLTPQAEFQGARFPLRNTAFASLVYRPGEHIWILERFNDRQHWPKEIG
jgi:broad specificity phosphatase PhoE